jgi:hypothetical protein
MMENIMYKLLPETQFPAQCIKRLSDNAFIPMSESNTDYQAFLKYQAEGGKVYGADEEIPADEGTQ